MLDLGPRTKPYLGGWRNTVTGLIYHNASTQTPRVGGTTISKITQTVADAVTEAAHDRAVQTAVHLLPDARDRIIAAGIPSPWRATAEEAGGSLSRADTGRILDCAFKIQRCYRAYRARVAARVKAHGTVDVSRDDEADVTERAGRSRDSLSARSVVATDFVMLNRGSPRTSSDFESLHNLLDRWRILETERAARTLLGSSRIAACGLVLSREIELLRAMDAMKSAARLKCRERKRRRLLDELSRPVVWRDKQGRPILVDTARVQRARQHRNVYASLADEELSVSERLDLLRGLRRVAGMHTCSQSHELIYLVDQELALLARRVEPSRLNWLRNRLKLSFLKMAHNVLQGDLEGDVHRFGWPDTSITRLCRTCGRLLPLEKFAREQRLRSSTCVYCRSMRTRRGPRVVYEPYERMLREVRRYEAKMGCYGSLAFVVGAKVVCRLVNEIWHGRSGISECDDLDELRLTRFQRELEWTPWNSLLLTEAETAVHRGITDIECFYDSSLLQKFRTKNLQAQMNFGSISDAERNIVTPSPKEDY